MAENMGTPPLQEPKKNNRTLMIVIVVLVVLCCCCVSGMVALYYGYDYMGDPLGIYGMLPIIGQAI
ncbi:MAG: hypothetical protein WBL25_08435 [Anaerolineales bacterium]